MERMTKAFAASQPSGKQQRSNKAISRKLLQRKDAYTPDQPPPFFTWGGYGRGQNGESQN